MGLQNDIISRASGVVSLAYPLEGRLHGIDKMTSYPEQVV